MSIILLYQVTNEPDAQNSRIFCKVQSKHQMSVYSWWSDAQIPESRRFHRTLAEVYSTSHLSDPHQTPASFPDNREVSLLHLIQDSVVSPWWLRWSRIHLQCRRPGFKPSVGKIPGRREWLPTPAFLGRIPWTEEPGGLQSLGS